MADDARDLFNIEVDEFQKKAKVNTNLENPRSLTHSASLKRGRGLLQLCIRVRWVGSSIWAGSVLVLMIGLYFSRRKKSAKCVPRRI